MKNLTRWVLLIPLLAALALPTPALASGLFDDRVVFGGNFTLESGETLDGDLVVFGGNATLEQDSRVTGEVVLMGGNLDADGTIEGSVVGLGGLISLGETAVVEGDVTVLGAQLDRADGARIEGTVISDFSSPLSFTFPQRAWIPHFDVGFSPVINFAWFGLKLLLWAALAVLVVLFLPQHTRRISQTAIKQPAISFGIGLLTIPALLVLAVALAITILLIPVSLVVLVIGGLAWMYGLIALGLEVGNRLAQLFKQDWAPAVAAGVGTFTLILVVNGLREMIPCGGLIFPALAGLVGLGAVLLTRFGSQDYPAYGMVPMPPAPPAPPLPPSPPTPPQVESPEGPSET
jgi:cytoskeletal protein CcmA (bactofilin family)